MSIQFVRSFSVVISLIGLISGLPLRADSSSSVQLAAFERIGPFGGDVRSLLRARDSNMVFAGTSDGQLFKSLDRGATWTKITPGLGRRGLVVDTLVQHPEQAGRFYAGAWDLKSDGGDVFESTDAGETWRKIPIAEKPVAVRSIAISPASPYKMVVGAHNGVYVTEDGGKSWVQIGRSAVDFPPVEAIAIDPRDPRVIYAGTWRLSYKTVDSGRTWTKSPRGMLLDSHVFSIEAVHDKPGVIYAAACSGIYRSSDGMRSWLKFRVLPGEADVRAHVVTVDPSNFRRVYVGSTEGLYVSENEGRGWRRLTDSRLTVHAIQIDPRDSRHILLGTENRGVLASGDGGRTWNPSNMGLSQFHIARIVVVPSPDGWLLAGVPSSGSRGGIYAYDDHANRWQALSAGLPARPEILSLVCLRSTGALLAGTARGIYLLPSGASLWTRLAGPLARLKIIDLAEDQQGSWVYAATGEGVYRARPECLRFEKPEERRPGPLTTSLVAPGNQPGIVFAGGSTGFLRSSDRGATWAAVSSGLPMREPVQCLAVSAGGDQIYVGTMAGLYESKDGGSSWRKARDVRLAVDISAVAFLDEGGQVILAADNSHGGLYISKDAGQNWEGLTSPGFDSAVRSIAQDPARPSQLYLGTISEGVYRVSLPPSVLHGAP